MKLLNALLTGVAVTCFSLPLAAAEPKELISAVSPQVGVQDEVVADAPVVETVVQEVAAEAEVVEVVTEEPQEVEAYEAEVRDESSPSVYGEASENDFIAFASEHCRGFINEGTSNLGFALGKRTAAKFSAEERARFNRDFAAKLIHDYSIDATAPCVLNTVSVRPVEQVTHAPKQRGAHALPKAKREIAVVAGQLPSSEADVTVSVAYRLERFGAGPWLLTNITFNGQPLVDRYREEYDAVAARGGVKAVLNHL